MKKIFDLLTSTLFPSVTCVACHDPRRLNHGAALCDRCMLELEEERLTDLICPRCLSPKRRNSVCQFCLDGGMEGLTAAYSPFHYHGVARSFIISFKFGSVLDAGILLSKTMAAEIKGLFFDAIAPVPLHPKRLNERGFNQALTLCELIGKENNIPVMEPLIRVKHTKQQAKIRKTSNRCKNVDSAFLIKEDVSGLHILLVDDVRTTGATARACAQTLLKAGAKEISLLTAAVAPHKEGKTTI